MLCEKMMKVSVVIPTKNAGSMFRDTLERLKAQNYQYEIELVFIDSGSTDGTVGMALEYGATVKSIPPQDFNHGLTRNLGIEMASGEIIVLLSQDAVPGDEYLVQNFVKAFDDPQVAGAYGRHVPREDADALTKRNLNRSLTGRTTEEIRWIEDWNAYKKLQPLQRHYFYNFDDVCSAVRKGVWQSMSFRANDFGEDIDWSQQVLEAGWKIAYWPKSFVIHSHDRSFIYDYQRNFQMFKKLYRQYGLCFVSSRKLLVLLTLKHTLKDWKYVIRHEKRAIELVKILFRIPFLSIATMYGQYRGVKAAVEELNTEWKQEV
jgi:rhamnosyltransferase